MSPVKAGFAALLLVPALLGAQVGAQATAQAPAAEPTFSGRVDVTVAEVEVFVADRDGRPVPDLTRDDFKVVEDGQPAEVTGLAPGTSQRLNLAIFFDQTTLDVTSRATALAALRRFVDTGLKPGDRVLLAAWDDSLEVRAEPTGDRAVLRAALDRLGAALPPGVRTAQERSAVQREIHDANPLDDERGTSFLARSQAKAALDNLRAYARARAEETRGTFGALQQMLVLLGGLPERKALLYIGGGPPLQPGADLFAAWQTRFSTMAPELGFSPSEVSRYDAGPQAQEVVNRANGAGISIFALALPVAGARSDAEDSGRAMHTLAEGTGGRVVVDVANPASFLEIMGRDLSSSYLVAYAPPQNRKPGTHKVEVTVKGGALVARHRETRRDGGNPGEAGDPLLRQALATMWAGEAGSAGEGNPLRAELAFDEQGKDDLGRLLVTGLVTFPLATLAIQPQEHFHTGHVTLSLVARDGKGKISGMPKAEVPIEIPNEHLLSAPGQTAGYKFTLHLNPTESVVAVAMRDDFGGSQGVIRAEFPGKGGSGREGGGATRVAAPQTGRVEPAAPRPDPPLREAIHSSPSTSLGVESAALLMSGQQGGDISLGALALPIPADAADRARLLVRVRLEGKGLLAEQTENILRIEGDLYALGAGEAIAASALERIEIDLASQRAAVERDGVDFLAGLDLRPGPYSLRMLVRNLDTGKLAVRNFSITVPDPASLKNAPLPAPRPAAGTDPRPTARTADIGPLDPPPFPDDAPSTIATAAVPAPVAPPAPPPETAEGRRLRVLARKTYREILALLATGRDAEALAAAAPFEDSLLLRANPMTVERLVEIEASAEKELAHVDPESLVPVLRLHQRLYQEATERQRPQGSTVARDVFLLGVDLLRTAKGGAPLAHQFLATFGAELMRSGTRHVGEATLRRVLADDPGDEIALLELAADAERRGDHAAAGPPLETLLRAHPEHREARLRQAVDLAQMGRTAEAEQRLTALLADETEAWRLALAYQELARLRLATKETSRAEAILREGLKRLPGDEKLTLLLAELQEKSWLTGPARLTVASLKPETGGGGGAARHRYSLPPEEPMASTLAALDRETVARRAVLAAALEKTAP
ncbi:MAG TPA: VWA domain-containing protein [Thermoanaerobaculia bacterium]|nr:VWA domain-containing protein [Thermoanaerobaculia bacterium]